MHAWRSRKCRSTKFVGNVYVAQTEELRADSVSAIEGSFRNVTREHPSAAQRLGHKLRDNLSSTDTARKPTSCCSCLRSSAVLWMSMSAAISFWCDRRYPAKGARMRMPFSPLPVRMRSRRRMRLRFFGARSPATSAAWWVREVTAKLPGRLQPARWKWSGSRGRCQEWRN